MSIKAIQFNSNTNTDLNTKPVKSYRAAEGTITTEKNIKPLPPQGHLVDDNLKTGIKYFFKDISYDMKSVKNGCLGTANDHQLGRLNDVGLRLGGIGIATYLASQTTNPKARLMEYIGLAAFLTSMSIYPKIAINTPAKILHGYDIDKQYIDDQGRKKSVHQDSNYIPYDMYNGKYKGEDLDAIGDKMGIPRDIKNRHDVIREQMRKIATQNNTLWMLTAGFATPLMTALLCSGIEKYIVSPGLEKSRNLKFNNAIKSILNHSLSENTRNNYLGDSINRIISKYEGKPLPQEEIENILQYLTESTDSVLSEGIKSDVEKLLSGQPVAKINNKILNLKYNESLNAMKGAQTKYIKDNILPTLHEIEEIIKEIKPECDLTKGIYLNRDELNELNSRIKKFADLKISSISGEASKHTDFIRENVLRFGNSFDISPNSAILTKESEENLIKFANIIGDFKKRSAVLDKCENFKFEHTNETILANTYEKFQKTLLKQLNISPKDYKRISNDKDYAVKILDEKYNELCKNEAKYKETFEKLGKILSDMEISLHGSAENESHIKDLITAIDKVYNETAQKLLDNGIGENTANRLVKGNFNKTAENKNDLINLLNGFNESKFPYSDSHDISAMKYFSEGKGSSKNLKISRLINRYQGEMNSFYRIMHSLDFYKRAININDLSQFSSVQDMAYLKKLECTIKNSMLNGSISDYILKLGVENAYEYKDVYNVGWALEPEGADKINQKGIITNSAKEGLNKNNKNGLIERFQMYITRFKNIIANDKTDFTKPNHILNENIPNIYSDMARTNEAKFNLVAQTPVDMLQKATGKAHADRKWLKSTGIITGIVFSIALLAQFGFGKIKNKHNLQKINNIDINEKQKQVQNENNK